MSNQQTIQAGGRRRDVVLPLLAVIGALVLLRSGGAPFDSGSGNARALGVVLPPLALGLAAAALCLQERWATGMALLGGVLAGLVRGRLYDPLRDRPCVRCLSSPFATHPDARLADLAALAGGLLIVAGLCIAFVHRRRLWCAVGALVVAASVTAYDTPHGMQIGAAQALVAVGVVALGAMAVRLALARRAMGRLADALSSGGRPDEILKLHLRDPGAWVEFAARSADGPLRWVTDEGAPVSARAARAAEAEAQHSTMVESRGQPVARIHHSRSLAPIEPELALRLEQAGLAAGLAAQVDDLAASRARIVARADAERRQLERDLHDGAQQYLLALAVDLSFAPTDAAPDGTDAHAALLDSRRDAEAALEELRRIARGTYPVLLDTGGLAPALHELSRRVGTQITVGGTSVGDLPAAAAAAVYGLVEELAASTKDAVNVTVEGTSPQVVHIVGGAVDPDSLNLERIAASRGNVTLMSGRVEVSFP